MDLHRIKNVITREHTLHTNEWKGAVLFLCTKDSVVLIKRSNDMPSHAGQIAFFGGHRQEGEETPWIVAQREFEEETSLSCEVIEFLGYLPVVIIGKYQSIVPVVGELKMGVEEFLASAKSNGEWDEVLIYSWKELSMEDNWEFAWKYTPHKSPIFFHTIRAVNYVSQNGNEDSHILWGATASMIWSLLQRYYYNYP